MERTQISLEPAQADLLRRLAQERGVSMAHLIRDAVDVTYGSATAPPTRDERLTLANHAEILPELPSTLMTSVIAEAGPDLFEWYRRRVRGLPADRDFLYVVAGRPKINLSLL